MTDPLDQVRERRAGLRAAIGRVERSLASPAAGRAEVWAKELASELQDLAASLEQHIRANEAPDGLLADVVDHAPRLAHRTDQLRDDHARLRAAASAVLDDLGAPEVSVTAVRDQVVELLEGLVRHRHLGADLVYEAYNVDIEAAD